jgi:signal peptidase II
MKPWGYSQEFDGDRPAVRPIPVHKRVWGRAGLYYGILVLVLLLDRFSKWLITQTLDLNHSLSLLEPFLRLTYVRNSGAAFSLLAGFNSPWRLVLFVTVAFIAFVVLTVVAHREQARGWSLLMPLALVSGGALGNMVDRIFLSGQVIDFIDVSYRAYHFPVFNVADSAVCVGVCWLLIHTFRHTSGGSDFNHPRSSG